MPTLTMPGDLGKMWHTTPLTSVTASGYVGATGTMTVKVDGVTLSSAQLATSSKMSVGIPFASWDGVGYAAQHTLEVTFTDDLGNTATATSLFWKVPRPLSATDSLEAAAASFSEVITQREQFRVKLVEGANALLEM